MELPKLIILRGPSGSGKSTVARELRLRARLQTALIEQDYLRRIVLKEKDVPGGVNAGLIAQTVTYCLEHGYNVILEGILFKKHYEPMLASLMANHLGKTHVYYFDIPFEETLIRHATKPNAADFGEREMRQWHSPGDVLGTVGERIIGEKLSKEEIISIILKETQL